MADILDLRIAELQRSHRLQRCFNAWAPTSVLSMFICSLLIMFLRLSMTNTTWLELPLIMLAALLPILSIPSAWRIRIPEQDLAAEIDILCEGRGLCMALSGNPKAQRDPDWMARIRSSLDHMQFPQFQWQAAKFVPLVLLCLLVALFMPHAELSRELKQQFAPFFDDLISELDQLEELNILDKEIKEEKRKELEQLKTKAQEMGMNQEIWLARDAVKSYMDQQKKLSGQRLAEAVVAAEQLKQQQNQAQQQKLMQALANLAEQNKNMLQQMKPEQLQQMAAMMQQMGEQLKLTPEQLAALQEHMQQNGLDLEKIAQMQQQNLLPQMGEKEQQQFAEDLLDKLNKQCQNMEQCGMSSMTAMLMQMRSGGVNRGPGHVQLTEKDPTNIETGTNEALMAGSRLNADGSITLAESVREADVNDEALKDAVRAAALQFDPAAADARRSATAPRHRASIARYFVNAPISTNAPSDTPAPATPKNEVVTPTEEGEIEFP